MRIIVLSIFVFFCCAIDSGSTAAHSRNSKVPVDFLKDPPNFTEAPSPKSPPKGNTHVPLLFLAIKFLPSADTNDFSTDKPPRKSGLFAKFDPCPGAIKCVPPIQCPAHIQMVEGSKPQPCELPDGSSHGLCCTTGYNHSGECLLSIIA